MESFSRSLYRGSLFSGQFLENTEPVTGTWIQDTVFGSRKPVDLEDIYSVICINLNSGDLLLNPEDMYICVSV